MQLQCNYKVVNMIKKLIRYKRRRLWQERSELRQWKRTQRMLSAREFVLPEDCAVEGMIVIPGVK
jgi:hypothetical protein